MGFVYRVHTSTQKKSFLGFRFAEPHLTEYVDASLENHSAQEYVAHVDAHTHIVSANLPIVVPQVGYDTLASLPLHLEAEEELTALENHAHSKKVLLSSDAMRFFIGQITEVGSRITTLDAVLAKARISFPSEDGWVVLNLERMETLLDATLGEAEHVSADLENNETVMPMTAGSLAEAIVSGNTHAAYQMISHRPMIALADAASDLDAVYRGKKGEAVTVSNMLKEHTQALSVEKLKAGIEALTSALDGTYSDEEQAVKMAIMKAVKELTA